MQVPLLDLRAQYAPLKPAIMTAFEEISDSQRFILGPKVEAFEQEMAAYCHTAGAVGVSSGSDALIIALMAEGIGHGDEVITSPFTFFATVGAIVRVGATPVFADIDPVTFNIDPAAVESKITGFDRMILNDRHPYLVALMQAAQDGWEPPETVTELEEYAFAQCRSLTYAYVPASVTGIGRNAFGRCDRLTIHGEAGSAAQRYAEENGIPFNAGK